MTPTPRPRPGPDIHNPETCQCNDCYARRCRRRQDAYEEAMADDMADPYWPFNGDREAFYSDRAERWWGS